jgi:hypothetical protein
MGHIIVPTSLNVSLQFQPWTIINYTIFAAQIEITRVYFQLVDDDDSQLFLKRGCASFPSTHYEGISYNWPITTNVENMKDDAHH